MKRVLGLAAAIAAMGFASANAAFVSFANDADTNGERAAPSPLTINGVTMNLAATFAGPPQVTAFAYLDANGGEGPAGLGVCKALLNGDCNPSSDDNITSGESVVVSFVNGPYTISGLSFTNESHDPISATETLELNVNNGGWVAMTFAQAIAGAWNDVVSIGFRFGGANAGQFYVNGFDATNAIPIPGALPLLLSGLAGLGFAARRKKAA